MEKNTKDHPETAAKKFIDKRFPDCQGALLAGSVVRGEATVASDLDIVIFVDHYSGSYRESFVEFDWPIEVFVHNLQSYKEFFLQDMERARPSLPRMVSEGIVLKDSGGLIDSIKKEAAALLAAGPKRWTASVIEQKRYFLTDALDDFIGSNLREEDLVIANTLAQLTSEFYLRVNGQWVGASKWTIRALRHYNPGFADRFALAFDSFYRDSHKEKVIQLVDSVMEPYGGRLFAGFSIGKTAAEQK
ncbi:nucleotidyltransferase domain-containing protein [Sediminibacillus dalangtanensis]|uniref:Nucleotidyltransferase domain-containing protein n=1 Tax=Sediminibacillus dalangtanensis TaxID=2729421 RepID=A0ABX7VTL9_9BACI|nr:nucleotidyltransferase domain-containing protein [Sediminibacillus dalangtanensis]QTM98970.1 nucleotidyltransferase domain-containing protein [Sediminibacillus dalangtanensis]